MEPNTCTEPCMERHIAGVARRLFIEKGYADTNMSDIAAAAGIKRSTLHYYFRTKDRLFQLLYGDIIRDMTPRIQEILQKDMPFWERIDRILDEYIRLFLQNPALPQFIIGEIRRDVNRLVDVAERLGIDGYIRKMAGIIATEVGKGTIRDVPPRMLCLAFYSYLVFPFLTRELVTSLLLEEHETFSMFLQEWKAQIIGQLRCFLQPELPLR